MLGNALRDLTDLKWRGRGECDEVSIKGINRDKLW